jgi:hypothetical protein
LCVPRIEAGGGRPSGADDAEEDLEEDGGFSFLSFLEEEEEEPFSIFSFFEDLCDFLGRFSFSMLT